MLAIINNIVNSYKSNSFSIAIDNITKIFKNIFIFSLKSFNIKKLYRRKRYKFKI